MVEFTLYEHQKIAIERARNMSSFALHFDVGTGKSLTAIQILRERYNREKRIIRTLIFAPSIVLQNWKEEWKKFTKIEGKNVVVLTGSGALRVKEFKKQCFDERGLRVGRVVVLNYESLLMLPLYEEIKKWQPEIFVLDEIHRCKNPSSKTAKALDELANKHTRPQLRLALTGTPVLNSPMDLFQPIKIMLGGFPTLESLVTGKHIQSFFHFRTLYFEDRNARWKGSQNYFPQWGPKPSTSELFGRLLSSISMSVEKKDCLSLPPEIDVTVPVPLTPEQRKDYDVFEKDLVAQIDGKTFTADIALTKALRLMQISSGFISGLEAPDGAELQPIKYEYQNTARENALKELLTQICVEGGKKAVVWATWANNYATISKVCEELGIKYVRCTGLESGKAKEEARKTFIENPDILVFIGNPLSSGIGINLVVAHYDIWYSRNFSLDQFIQAKARIYRAGQTESVIHYHLVAQDTIELDILDALQSKKNMADVIMAKTNLYKKIAK
jgi:SNF2 family DNA or RNA helicase